MARTKATKPAPIPTPERVQAAIRSGDFTAAVDLARQLHTLTPTPENLALHKRALTAAAAHFADRDKAIEFNIAMAEAEKLDAADPGWIAERAALLARGGRLADSLALADPATQPAVLAHAADRALRTRSKEFLPAELHAGFDAVLATFRHHEAGNETAARESLEPIGLRSPYLEWKVMLRGLLAHAAGDDARAAENFGRLDPGRLPAKLAAPLRAAVDPAFRAAIPADTATSLLKQHEKLAAGPMLDGLKAIAKELGRDKPLSRAFKTAENVLPHLKTAAPHLIPRLANCFYHALLQLGEPHDLPQYRRLFGAPADDPDFHKLLGQVGELVGDLSGAHAHWQRYEAWLAAKPRGWPDAITSRARALIWIRMGENARQAAEEPDEQEDDLLGFFGPPRRKKKSKPLAPPAEDCFRHAAQLAPDWPAAVSHLFATLAEAKKFAEAERIAGDFLARHPDDLPALTALGDLFIQQGRPAEAAEVWLRAAAVNPLDRPTRSRAAMAVLSASRRCMIQGDPAGADAMLEPHRALLEDHTPAGLNAMRAVILTKLGQPDEAAACLEKGLAVPGARVSVAYRVMVDSQLAKVKPAEKRVADQRFAEELAKSPTPLEVNQLIASYDWYHIHQLTYRGQKTHEKKIFDQVARCLTADAPELDFERLGEVLLAKHEWKHVKKLADGCARRFPTNPHFPLFRCVAGLETGEREYHVEQRLRQAKRLAETATEPRHRALLERIDALLKQIASPFDLLGDFFGGRRG